MVIMYIGKMRVVEMPKIPYKLTGITEQGQYILKTDKILRGKILKKQKMMMKAGNLGGRYDEESKGKMMIVHSKGDKEWSIHILSATHVIQMRCQFC